MPLTIIVATMPYGRDMMTMIETKTNDTTQTTKTTMDDANECAPPASCGSRAPNRTRKHAAKRVA